MASNHEIPTGWRRGRLQDVAEVVGGSTPSRTNADYWCGDIPWVAPSELTQLPGRYLDCSRESISEQGRKAAGLRVLPAGSVLLTSRATIGATAINRMPVTTNQGFQSLVPKRDINGLWLYYSVSASHRELERRGAGSTFHEVSRDGVRSLPILVPPLTEQRRIASILDSFDEAIERTEEVIAATERLRDALLHDLLTRGLPGRHTEWKEVKGLGTIPACWDVARLGDTLALDQPGAWGDEPTAVDPGVPVLRAADLTRDGRVETERVVRRHLSQRDRERRLMQNGDLVLERSGGGPAAPVGRIALIEAEGPIYCSNFCQHLRVDPTRLNAGFAARALWHRYMRGVTGRLEQRTTGIRNLDYDGYLLFPIPLPQAGEQDAIASVLLSAEEEIGELRDAMASLRQLKLSASDSLLRGETRHTGRIDERWHDDVAHR